MAKLKLPPVKCARAASIFSVEKAAKLTVRERSNRRVCFVKYREGVSGEAYSQETEPPLAVLAEDEAV
jgi:hypothetical protein